MPLPKPWSSPGEDRHRALADGELTQEAVLAMVDRLETDQPARAIQRRVLSEGNHPWADFLSAPVNEVALADAIETAPELPTPVPSGQFDIGAVAQAFESDGLLMVDGRQPRRRR